MGSVSKKKINKLDINNMPSSLAELKKLKPKNVKIDGRKVITTVTRGSKSVDFIADLSNYDFLLNISVFAGGDKELDDFLINLQNECIEKYGDTFKAQMVAEFKFSEHLIGIIDSCFGDKVVEELLEEHGTRLKDITELLEDLSFAVMYALLENAEELASFKPTVIDNRDDM